MKISIALNLLGVASLAWLTWLSFFAARPRATAPTAELNVLAVDASTHSGVLFLIPAALLLAGLILQVLSVAGGSK